MSKYVIINYNCGILEGNDYKLKWHIKGVAGAGPPKMEKKINFEELEFN